MNTKHRTTKRFVGRPARTEALDRAVAALAALGGTVVARCPVAGCSVCDPHLAVAA